MKTSKLYLSLLLTLILTAANLQAQDKNSVRGDYEALRALYNATQGQSLPSLSSRSELPSIANATYPYMYMINGEIHALDRNRDADFTDWMNVGAPWIDDTGWTNMTPETMGDAVGITTDSNGRVTGIDMQKMHTPIIGDGYASLGNNLAGELPVEINNLHKLQFWNVKNNFLYGAIPSISNWSEVVRLSFAGQWWELNLQNRRAWYESNHRFGKETLDEPFGPDNNVNMSKKVVTTNRFKTNVPSEIDGFQHLELIELRHQYLTGTLPEWDNLPSIKGIFLDESRDSGPGTISGSLPDSWGNLTTTAFLKLGAEKTSSKYSGDFPQSINENWDSLWNIAIEGHGFTGPIPEFLLSRDKNYVYLGDNNFSGSFPLGYFNGDNSELNKWIIGRNNLSGELPQTVPSPSYPQERPGYWVTAPGIGHNNFTGQLPEWIQSMRDLQTWYIVGNSFEGPFPKTVAEQDRLKTFYISNNNFSGPLPDVSWGDRPNPWIYMGGNNFEGIIPDSWISMFAGSDINMPFSSYSTFTGTGSSLSWNSVTNAVAYELQIRDRNGNLVRNITSIPNSYEVSGLPSGEYTWRVRGLNWYSSLSRIYMNNNNLSGRIPDWPLNLEIDRFYLHQNRYTFVDIGPVYDALKAHMGDGFRVDNQKPFGREQNRTMPEGEEVVFDLSEYDYTNNSYQWLKDGTPINGENSPILTVSSISSADEGSYVLEVKNSDLAELGTHQSQPIHFQIGVDDGGNSTGDGSKDSDNDDGDDNGSGDDRGSEDDGSNTGQAVFPAAPELISPIHLENDVSIAPQLQWSSVDGADYYILHMSRSNPSGMVLDIMIEDTTYTPTEVLGDDSRHHWRVRAVKDGEMGEWSGINFFDSMDANLPPMADLVGPDHRAEYVSVYPELKWEPVEADRFRIRILHKESSELIVLDDSESTIYTPVEALEPETAYIWQVKSVIGGNEGAWGPRWEFNTGEYAYNVGRPVLLSPDRGAEHNTLIPTFEWQNVDADRYIILVSKTPPSNAKRLGAGGDDDPVIVYEEIGESVYTPAEPLDPEKTYYWRVKAVKDAEEGEWSETWEFKTPKGHVNVFTHSDEKPHATELKQNYPNPFNPVTQIEFTLADVQNVSITVFNIAGQQVATLVDGFLQAGRHTATFDAGRLASGVYIYRFISDNHQFTRKMTLVK